MLASISSKLQSAWTTEKAFSNILNRFSHTHSFSLASPSLPLHINSNLQHVNADVKNYISFYSRGGWR